MGICVAGFQTDTMPAFYCDNTPFPVDVRCETAQEIANLVRARDEAGLKQAILVVNPLPAGHTIPFDEVERVVASALRSDAARKLKPAEITPYLLSEVRRKIGDAALDANVELLKRNAELAANIGVQLVQAG